MKALEYRFVCRDMKAGWCQKTDSPGCFFDCKLRNCNNCINEKVPKRKEPCSGCWMNKMEA